ncbi:MAG: bifunctional 4-hydroxy-2-oxoglutarate aldolase/2-dehydro-3-deoxy-phosphogluconate aldolase [Atopobiaceae bacterium]|nr:bifunctional 4-hydroxy-2-oxoglutarate aldolase/2-dehydro-3-deoxy-phosphogluconate aldolase [Atopobiaceae bacterium]
MDPVLVSLHEIGLVPVVKINDSMDALPLAKALIAGGLPCAEITFRTAAGAESIRLMTQSCPEMLVGAGTVLTTTQVDEAVAAGAKFIVSPGFNPVVVDYCLSHDILMVPGISDASGVEQCLMRGIEVVKFFPAEQAGGLPYIKALSGPYSNVRFMPTGGISPDNLMSYLSCSSVFCCGGTWMVKEELIDNSRFDEVERLCCEAVKLMGR